MGDIFNKFDDQVYEEIVERKETHEIYENFYNRLLGIELSNTEARKQLRGIENYLAYKKEKDFEILQDNQDLPKYKESTEICADGNYKSDKLLKMNKEQSKDINYLLEAHGFDSGFWQIVSARNNIWNVYSKLDGVQQLYSSKITVKPIVPEFQEEWIQNVIDKLDFSKIKLKDHKYKKDGVTVEINFADVHIGKYITALVAMGNYNSDIAIEKVKTALIKSIQATGHYNIKKIIFIVGQDYINFDTLQGTTTKLTRQDMNEFYQVVYEKAYELLINSVEMLRNVAPIEVIYVKGNHDKLSTYTMISGLEKIYRNEDSVEVDFSMRQRKYRTYGNTLVGYGHGEEEKSRIFDCMQDDEKDNWHKKYKYFHLSHKHTESRKEKAGVIYNWLGSLSESCKWTWESGFVGSEKKGHVYVYDDKEGKIAEFFIKV